MSLSAETQVETEQARRYVAEICRQFEERARTKPQLGVRVQLTETHGSVDFGWGRCLLRADEGALIIRVEADDDAGLSQVQELVRRHVEKHGEDEQLTLAWPREEVAGADGYAERRDAMRGFHHRMRH